MLASFGMMLIIHDQDSVSPSRAGSQRPQPRSRLTLGENRLDTRKVVNVVIAKNFDLASEEVQVQGLEVVIDFGAAHVSG